MQRQEVTCLWPSKQGRSPGEFAVFHIPYRLLDKDGLPCESRSNLNLAIEVAFELPVVLPGARGELLHGSLFHALESALLATSSETPPGAAA